MNKGFRFFVLLLFTGLAFYFLYPTIQWYFVLTPEQQNIIGLPEEKVADLSKEQKQQFKDVKEIRQRSIKLGLDLQGGVFILMQINEDDLRKKLLETYGDSNVVNEKWEDEYKSAVQQTLDVLKSRMDKFGVSEPVIQKTYSGQISVQLPGLDNPQLIRDALSKVGKLEFHMVDEESMGFLMKYPGIQMSNGTVVSKESIPTNFFLPPDSAWYPYFENDLEGSPRLVGWYILKTTVELDGTYVEKAMQGSDNDGNPSVNFQLSPEGGDIFYIVTSKNTNKRLAIVLDEKVKSAPYIRAVISDSGTITSESFKHNPNEVLFLINVLKAGALPVKIDIVQENVIGPTLGQDSINAGIQAAAWGALAVVIFMILYYRVSGFISMVGLVFNMWFLMGTMGLMGNTMTLSGIAGIALTVGMAVDASVIIFERIREEMRRARSFKHALENGYEMAKSTIWDSNITTLIASAALAMSDVEAVRGFGLTLSFGIIANIFASLYVMRFFFDWLLDTFKLKKLSI
ncbi:MAG: protein-export membrane protein SecD [Spirochaetes bacterium GWF1_51_8]|nr:MAG: protein-export membrane protein SecD [Spirochaetes bacterium GWF1_51_8]